MTECTHLSDRMPAAARGTARWSAADAQHLETCQACAAEWRIVRDAARLGRSIESSLDTERAAERVVTALQAPIPRPSALRHARWAVPLGLAAGLFLLLGRPNAPDGVVDSASPDLTLLPEAEALSDAELELVIRLLPVSDPASIGGAESLSDEELILMLEDLEG